MSIARSIRILLFSGMVVALLISVAVANDSQARPLHDVEIALDISASPTSYSNVGEVITYTYTVFNRSGYEMYDLLVEDDLAAVSCPSSTIEGSMTGPSCESESMVIEGQMTCSGTYIITQADIDNGQLTNTASVSGTYEIPGGCGGIPQVIPVDAGTSHTILAAQQASISLSKTASPTSFFNLGEVITYTYTVENIGNVSLAGPITITDDMITVSCPPGGLAPSESMDCTATYTTTEADVVTGFIRNTATASAGPGLTASDDLEILLEASPSLSLEKSANRSIYTHVWELIIYTYSVENSGNVPIEGPFVVQDQMLDEWNCPETVSLGPGESLVCLGYYRTRDPLDTIANCATVDGTYQGATIASNEACAQVFYEPPPPTQEPGAAP
ncbi:MAG: hypothetical protein PVF70_06525 [Anaerolineales bacterium]